VRVTRHPNHSWSGGLVPSNEKSPRSRIAGRGRHRVYRGPRQAATDADPLRAGLDDLCHGHSRKCEDVHRLRDRFADRADLRRRSQAGRVEDVGACSLVRLQPRDRVVEIGVAADVVFGPRRQRERKAESAGRFCGGGDLSPAWWSS
jgi:hypothetical protein